MSMCFQVPLYILVPSSFKLINHFSLHKLISDLINFIHTCIRGLFLQRILRHWPYRCNRSSRSACSGRILSLPQINRSCLAQRNRRLPWLLIFSIKHPIIHIRIIIRFILSINLLQFPIFNLQNSIFIRILQPGVENEPAGQMIGGEIRAHGEDVGGHGKILSLES